MQRDGWEADHDLIQACQRELPFGGASRCLGRLIGNRFGRIGPPRKGPGLARHEFDHFPTGYVSHHGHDDVLRLVAAGVVIQQSILILLHEDLLVSDHGVLNRAGLVGRFDKQFPELPVDAVLPHLEFLLDDGLLALHFNGVEGGLTDVREQEVQGFLPVRAGCVDVIDRPVHGRVGVADAPDPLQPLFRLRLPEGSRGSTRNHMLEVVGQARGQVLAFVNGSCPYEHLRRDHIGVWLLADQHGETVLENDECVARLGCQNGSDGLSGGFGRGALGRGSSMDRGCAEKKAESSQNRIECERAVVHGLHPVSIKGPVIRRSSSIKGLPTLYTAPASISEQI